MFVMNKFSTKILFFILINCYSLNVFALDKPYIFDNVTVTFGNWFENYKQVQTDVDGGTSDIEIAPYFSVAMDYAWKYDLFIIPEIGYVVQREAGTSKISKNLFFIRGDIGYYVKDWFRLRAGTSLMILTIKGNGGETTLPNGGGSETYYVPTERRTALNQTLDFGMDFIHDKISLRFQSYIYAFMDTDERMISYSTSLSYLIPLKEL